MVGMIRLDLQEGLVYFYHHNKVDTVAAGDAQTVISYLTECRRMDPDFFFDYKTDEKGRLSLSARATLRLAIPKP